MPPDDGEASPAASSPPSVGASQKPVRATAAVGAGALAEGAAEAAAQLEMPRGGHTSALPILGFFVAATIWSTVTSGPILGPRWFFWIPVVVMAYVPLRMVTGRREPVLVKLGAASLAAFVAGDALGVAYLKARGYTHDYLGFTARMSLSGAQVFAAIGAPCLSFVILMCTDGPARDRAADVAKDLRNHLNEALIYAAILILASVTALRATVTGGGNLFDFTAPPAAADFHLFTGFPSRNEVADWLSSTSGAVVDDCTFATQPGSGTNLNAPGNYICHARNHQTSGDHKVYVYASNDGRHDCTDYDASSYSGSIC